MSMRLVMMGTGTFALPTLRALLASLDSVAALYTQPDRSGRGHHHHRNLMKELAAEHGVPVFQPDSVNTPESLSELGELQADLYVVAAYGQILSADLLSLPRFGAINVHASLLPKYRGAAPIPFAILGGESETGVTIFRIEPKLDAGPVLGSISTPIDSRETSGELELRLAELAVRLTLDVVSRIETGECRPIDQDLALVTRAPRLTKADGQIDWTRKAQQIDRHVRAMQPWPGSFSFVEITPAQTVRVMITDVEVTEGMPDAVPGQVLVADGKRLVIQAGSDALVVYRLKPEGKRAMSVAEFQCGHALSENSRMLNAGTPAEG